MIKYILTFLLLFSYLCRAEIGSTVYGSGNLWTDNGAAGISYAATNNKEVVIDGSGNASGQPLLQIKAPSGVARFAVNNVGTLMIGGPNGVFTVPRVFIDAYGIYYNHTFDSKCFFGINYSLASEGTLSFWDEEIAGVYKGAWGIKADGGNTTGNAGACFLEAGNAASTGVYVDGGNMRFTPGKKQAASGGTDGNICSAIDSDGTALGSTVTRGTNELVVGHTTYGDNYTTGYNYEAGTFASIFFNDNTTPTTVANGATHTMITNFNANGLSSNCTADFTNNVITLTKIGSYDFISNPSFSSPTGSSTWHGSAFLDGVEQLETHQERKLAAGGDVGSMTMIGTLNVTNAPVNLELRFTHDQGGPLQIIITHGTFKVDYKGHAQP